MYINVSDVNCDEVPPPADAHFYLFGVWYQYYVTNNQSISTEAVVTGLWKDDGVSSALSPVYLDGLL